MVIAAGFGLVLLAVCLFNSVVFVCLVVMVIFIYYDCLDCSCFEFRLYC